jgi:isopenicillin-N N-acyltransferase-like protein
MDAFPILHVSGTARRRGQAHGEELRDPIRRGLELWFEWLEAPQPAIDGFLRETSHLAAADEHTPRVLDEIRGIAEGARVPFETLFAYNLADEQQVFLDRTADKCTAVGLRGAVSSSGQTMDTPTWFDETKVVIASHEDETGLDVLSFTIAGIVALCGVNGAGVSVWCNAVYQLAASRTGVPVSCIARSVLSQPSLEHARTFVRMTPHASGQNYVIGSPGGVVSLECSASSVVEARPDGTRVWHTNHPVASTDADDPAGDESSHARDAFVESELVNASGADDLRRILSDRTTPVCKLGDTDTNDFGYTLWGVVVEHTVPPRVWAAPGPPSRTPWHEIVVGAAVTA